MTSPVSTMTSRNTYLDIDAAMEAFPEIADSESVRLLCDSTDSFRGTEPHHAALEIRPLAAIPEA